MFESYSTFNEMHHHTSFFIYSNTKSKTIDFISCRYHVSTRALNERFYLSTININSLLVSLLSLR